MQTELTQALTALEAAAEAIKKHLQPQHNMPYPFEVGKVYKATYEQKSWVFKFKSYDANGFKVNYDWCINLILNHFVENDCIILHGKTFSPADPSEYIKYLPDGHPDKIPQISIKGAWYEVVSVDEDDTDFGIKIGDKVQCIEHFSNAPHCILKGEEFGFYMHQLRHLPNYVPPVEYITEVDKLPVITYETSQKVVAFGDILRIVAYCNSQFEADREYGGWVFCINSKMIIMRIGLGVKSYGYHFNSRKAIELAKNTPDFIKKFEVWMG